MQNLPTNDKVYRLLLGEIVPTAPTQGLPKSLTQTPYAKLSLEDSYGKTNIHLQAPLSVRPYG
jgi:hypothetical protein